MSRPSSSQDSTWVLPALILFGGLTLLLIGVFSLKPSTSVSTITSKPTLVAVNATEVSSAQSLSTVSNHLDPVMVSAGETIFQGVCVACHGFNAKGIPGLGKSLIGSTFVNGKSDTELLAFLHTGRAVDDPFNTTGVMMPPKGGSPNLSDDDLNHVIVYIRSLNAPAGTVAQAPTTLPAASGPTAAPIVFVPLPLSGPTATAESTPTDFNSVAIVPTQQVATPVTSVGEAAYVQNCIGCHGNDGRGLPNLAPDLTSSLLLTEHDGIALLTMLTKAQPPANPELGFQHPYRGGYPELSDEQLRELIAYLYTLPKE